MQRGALLSLLVGVMSCIMGAARLGGLQIFLSRTLMTAFVSGSAVIIIVEMLGDMLGIKVPQCDYPWQNIRFLIGHLQETNVATLLVGLFSMGLFLIFKCSRPAISKISRVGICGYVRQSLLLIIDLSTLLVFAASSALANYCASHGVVVQVLGDLPIGLPPITVPELPQVEVLTELTPGVFTMALMVFIIAASAGLPFAIEHGYSINGNQELFALGCANVAGSLFGAFPISGSMSRSAVNSQCGASSTVSTIVTAGVVACALSFLASAFTWLPSCSLAALIIVSVLGLLGINEYIDAFAVARGDFLVMISTFMVCIGFGMKAGLFVGFIISIGSVTHHAAQPNMVILGELSSGKMVTAAHFPSAETTPLLGTVSVRLDAPLVFANADGFKKFVRKEVERVSRNAVGGHEGAYAEGVRFVLVDMKGVNHVDVTGLQVLSEILQMLQKKGIQLLLCNLKNHVIHQFVKASNTRGTLHIPQEHLFLEIDDAIDIVKGVRTVADAGRTYSEYIKRNMPTLCHD